MRVIYGLRAVDSMLNAEVKLILHPPKLDMSILASASIDFMLTNLITTPHLAPNLDFIANPNLFEYSDKLDKYLLELKLINPAIPYTNDQLRTIFSEICAMFYMDLYSHLKAMVLSMNWCYVKIDYSVSYCNYETLVVEYHGTTY